MSSQLRDYLRQAPTKGHVLADCRSLEARAAADSPARVYFLTDVLRGTPSSNVLTRATEHLRNYPLAIRIPCVLSVFLLALFSEYPLTGTRCDREQCLGHINTDLQQVLD